MEYNSLLRRQLRKHFGSLDQVPADLQPLLRAVSESYDHYEEDRKLSDRSMEISSKELYEKNVLLQRQNERLDAFVYRVSHDLKAPVNNITMLSTMLKEMETPDMAANPILQRIMHDIGHTAERMGERIRDLLVISRIEQTANMPAEAISLPELLAMVVRELDGEIGKREAKIVSDFRGFEVVMGNHENMYSLLSNLLSNALKYRSPERTPEIRLETSQVPGYDLLSISDNGIGIDLERHGAKLFGMFNRFHSHVEGTGVGLYIIKNIIENAGGKIEVESTVGVGTTFKIYFKSDRN